ncbi:MAG: N-6 DNA methylase, partial [Deltaproteobacteria bacterium]|nr:N-6 DNA methylase [Deltaproteobacteria bacterium]
MFNIKEFFKKRDFTFGKKDSDIKPKKIILSENESLSKKLEDKVFVYDSPQHAYTSFYLINTPLLQEELFQIKRYIWNENKYDLYFTLEKRKKSFIATLFYAKTNPKEKEIKIASFKGDEQDTKQIEKIDKGQFKSGLFWLNYSELLNKIKKSKSIDKKLIKTLKNLRDQLTTEYKRTEIKNIQTTVQALIERTLFIKFLEDNHIINSYFYNHYFNDSKTSYKNFLNNDETDNIIVLFKSINEIFNNILFKEPINKNRLTHSVLKSIYDMISQKDFKTGQLNLFDFQFNIMPIEFIGRIYEVFLEKKQLNAGIFYTPQNLAQLIIDYAIKKKGSILDPSCGSGIFLNFAFRKLLELEPPKSDIAIEIIEHRNNLIKNYIFGIEKEDIARRTALFSLYLELL